MRFTTVLAGALVLVLIGATPSAQAEPRELAANAPGFSWPAEHAVIGNVLVYAGASAESDVEPWRSDGTMAGTALLKDIGTISPSFPAYFTAGSSVVFFAASGQSDLWKSHGTSESTQLVRHFDHGLVALAAVGDRAFFSTFGSNGLSLWTSDGSDAGTVELRAGLLGQVPAGFVALGQQVLFAADDGVNGLELWRTDGTPAGTTMLKDLKPGSASSEVAGLTVSNGLVFFTALSGSTHQLWRSDGTAGGTFPVTQLADGVLPAYPQPAFGRLRAVGNSVFFVGQDDLGAELWRSDGTTAGTYRVADICVGTCGSSPSQIVVMDGTAYLAAWSDAGGSEVWRSDGTPGGTYQLKDVMPGGGGNNPLHLTVVGSYLYFTLDDGVHGTELWVSDGTTAGTMLAFDLTPGAGSTTFQWVAAAAHGLYFATYAPGNYTSHLWFEEVIQPVPPRLVNLSTRARVMTGDDVMIGGFIIGGSSPKTVVVRARGPSMAAQGVPGTLANPLLQLFSGATQIAVNDNWADAANQAQVQASGFAPADALESAILVTLNPGAYTAIVTGVGATTGVAIVEVFEVDAIDVPLINISTRGRVQTGDSVMIGGFIVQGEGSRSVVVRARGPSLSQAGVPGVLANPLLQLFSGSTQIAVNDNWGDAANAAELEASGFAPSHSNESAILITLQPGAYTAIVSGVGETSGVGIVELFRVQ